VFGANSITSGASSDLEQATRTARAMVEKFGMSELGPWTISSEKGEVSGETRSASDKAVQRLTQEAYSRSKQLLVANRAVLDKVAAALLEHETLTGEEIKLLAQVPAPISIPPLLRCSVPNADALLRRARALPARVDPSTWHSGEQIKCFLELLFAIKRKTQ
jgi:hypothetical protein